MEIQVKAIWKGAIAALVAIILIVAFWSEAALFLSLTLGGGVVAFFLSPICRLFERRFPRGVSAVLSMILVAVALALILLFILPALVRQTRQIAQAAPAIFKNLEGTFARLSRFAREQGLEPDLTGVDWTSYVPALFGGMSSVVGRASGFFFRFGLSIMLGAYFLIGRERILLQLELMIPQKCRKLVIRMAAGSVREVRTYLRAQLMVCLFVGVLSALGLFLIGVDAPVALGLFVGVCNIVPYFGPILGGIPAVLTALGRGWLPALMAIGVLFVVQQLDGFLISPRVMNGVTGLNPVTIVLALALGGNRFGVVGILLALPMVLIVRFCYRVWATRHETIEMCEEM